MGNQFMGSFGRAVAPKEFDPVINNLYQSLFGNTPVVPGPAAPTSTPQGVSQDIVGEEEIVATGTRPRSSFRGTEAEIPDLPLNNSGVLEELAAQREKNPKRKGMFGVKGTLRDILGTVGDAFLVQSGNKQVYAPQRERERRADAMVDFTSNPIAAAERLADEGFIEEAQELAKYVQSNASEAQKRAMAEQAAAQKSAIDGAKLLGQFAGPVRDQESYTRQLPRMQAVIDRFGLKELVGELPREYNPAFMEELRQAGMQVQQQITTGQGERRLDQGDRRQTETERRNRTAETIARERNDISRSKGSAGRNTSDAQEAAPLLRIIENGGTLTKGQEEKLNRLGYHPNRGQGKGGSGGKRPPPLQRPRGSTAQAPQGKMVFRNGRLVPANQ